MSLDDGRGRIASRRTFLGVTGLAVTAVAGSAAQLTGPGLVSAAAQEATPTLAGTSDAFALKSALDARDYITQGSDFDLQAMVSDAELTGRAMYFPGGNFLTPTSKNISLNNLEPSFTYRFFGEGKKSRILFPAGMIDGDFLLRANQTAAGAPVSDTFVSNPRVEFENLVVVGSSSPQGGFFDTYQRAFFASRVQFYQVKFGFRTRGYTDLNRLEQIKSMDITDGGWTFQQRGNGDGLVISGFMAYATAGMSISACQGASISGVVSGWHEFISSDVTLTQSHIEGDGTESPRPLLSIRGSRVNIPDGRLYTPGILFGGVARAAIEIDDSDFERNSSRVTLGHQLTFVCRLDHPSSSHYGASQGVALHVKNAHAKTELRLESVRQEIFYNSGSASSYGFEETTPRLTAVDPQLHQVLNVCPPLLLGNIELRRINAKWELNAPGPTSGMRTFRRAAGPIGLDVKPVNAPEAGSNQGFGTYYYKAWTCNAEKMDTPGTDAKPVTLWGDRPIARIVLSGIVGPASVRIVRGLSPTSFTHWADFSTPAASVVLFDQGTHIAGVAWSTENLPRVPTTNDTQDGYSFQSSDRRIVTGLSAPTTGAWRLADRVDNSSPAPNKPSGWVCVTAGTPGLWKAMANLAP